MGRRLLLTLAILVPVTAGAQEPRASAIRAERTVPTVTALRSQMESLEAANRDLGSRVAQLEGVVGELRRFRERVLFAIEPELAAFGERIAALESAWTDDYEQHRHSFTTQPFGWGTRAVVDNCADCLIPFISQDKVGTAAKKTTTVPD